MRCFALRVVQWKLFLLCSSMAASLVWAAETGASIDRFLDPNGTLHLPAGFEGAIEVDGWGVTASSGGAPRFLKMAQETGEFDPRWNDRFGGPPGIAGAVLVVAAGPGEAVYAGGAFDLAINDPSSLVQARNIAKWDGSGWSSLGTGMDQPVQALAVDAEGNVYAGGFFSNAGGVPVNNIACWNGREWLALGEGTDSPVIALATHQGKVYAAGYFTRAGGQAARRIAVWDGTAWSSLGGGLDEDPQNWPYVQSLAAGPGGDIYIGGNFQSVGGVAARNIARWDGRRWNALGAGLGSDGPFSYSAVSAVAISSSGRVYAGGYFGEFDSPFRNLASWDGLSWSGVGEDLGFNLSGISSLETVGDRLYVGGYISSFENPELRGVVSWDGQEWSPLGEGLSGSDFPFARTMAVDERGRLYVGGNFTVAGDVNASFVAQWHDSSWSALGKGLKGILYAAAVSANGELYLGGDFNTLEGVAANHVGKWTGFEWEALGEGVNGKVYALVLHGNELFAGGDFSNAGSMPARNMARWDGEAWSALREGLDGPVLALAVDQETVYAGGRFSQGVAQWNGSAWEELGAGLGLNDGSGFVRALVLKNEELYAGGAFHLEGETEEIFVARWDGRAWASLGSGLDGPVNAMAVWEGELIVAGHFSLAGGEKVPRIARWDGEAWMPFSSGMSSIYDYILSLQVAPSGELYAGGYFQEIGGATASGIAKWNGTEWISLGTGLGGDYPFAYALALDGEQLYVAGNFERAGGDLQISNLARWSGNRWSSVNGAHRIANHPSGPVYALAVHGNDVFVGGAFEKAGPVLASNIARWDGESWFSLGSGVEGPVRVLAVQGDSLFAGGDFIRAGGRLVNYVARWSMETESWDSLGTGTDGSVRALAVEGGTNLYVGGIFTRAGGLAANRIARFGIEGGGWAALGSGVSGGDFPQVMAVAAGSNGEIYVGGNFASAGGRPANRIAKWSSLTNGWSGLGSGVAGAQFSSTFVNSIAISPEGDVFVGGEFIRAGGRGATNVARWTPSETWLPVGTGLSIGNWEYGTVRSLVFHQEHLYAAGYFDRAGPLELSNLARWNGENWEALGRTMGFYAQVQALALRRDDLFIGGEFATAGGRPSLNFAHYNESGSFETPPVLGWQRRGEDLEISWPIAAELYLLEFSPALSPDAWQPFAGPPEIRETRAHLRIKIAPGSGFFRLRRSSPSVPAGR